VFWPASAQKSCKNTELQVAVAFEKFANLLLGCLAKPVLSEVRKYAGGCRCGNLSKVEACLAFDLRNCQGKSPVDSFAECRENPVAVLVAQKSLLESLEQATHNCRHFFFQRLVVLSGAQQKALHSGELLNYTTQYFLPADSEFAPVLRPP